MRGPTGRYNDFDINLIHLPSLASTNAVFAVPHRVVHIIHIIYVHGARHFVLIWRAFGAVVSKLGLQATRRLRELEMRQNLGGDEMLDPIDVISNRLVANTEERAKLTLTSNALQDRASAEVRHQEQLCQLATDQMAMADSHTARLEQLQGKVVEFVEENYGGWLLCERADFQALAERALRDATASRGRAAEQMSRDLRRVHIRFGQAAALAVQARAEHLRQQESTDHEECDPVRRSIEALERDVAQTVAADAEARLVKVKRRFRELHELHRTDSDASEAALCTGFVVVC